MEASRAEMRPDKNDSESRRPPVLIAASMASFRADRVAAESSAEVSVGEWARDAAVSMPETAKQLETTSAIALSKSLIAPQSSLRY